MRAMKYLFLAPVLALVVACGDDTPENNNPDGGTNNPADASTTDDCFTNPTTHEEIINACTTAVKVEKTPVLPLLNSDGTLPPLP